MAFLKRIAPLLCILPSLCHALPRFSGYCQQGNTTVRTSATPSSNVVQGSYPRANVTAYITGGAVGYVTTSGTTVTWVSGTQFDANSDWNGLTVTINGSSFTISTVSSVTQFTTTASVGTNTTPVAYSITTAPSPIFSDYAGATPKSNPLTCDSTGYFFFYAANSTLDLKFSGTGITTPFTLAAVSGIDPLTIPLTVSSRSYIAAGLTFYQACASAAAQGLTLVIDQTWYGIATSATCAAAVQGGGGNIQPASGQTVTFTVANPGTQKICDISGGGSCTITSLTGIVYPEMWGDVPNASNTDYSANIQAAVNSINALGGGTLHFSASANGCHMAQAINIGYPNISYAGDVAACIKKPGGAPGTVAQIFTTNNGASGSGVSNIHIDGLTFDSNQSNQGTNSEAEGMYGVFLGGCSNCSFTNNIVKNALDGLAIGGYGGTVVVGVITASGSTWTYVSGTDFSGMAPGLALTTNVGTCTVATVNHTTNHSLTCAADQTGATGYSTSSYAGVGNNLEVSGNYITANYRNGISQTAGTNTHIFNNHISYSVGTAPQAAIDVEPYQLGCFLAGSTYNGNEFDHNGSYGLLLQAKATYDPNFAPVAIDNNAHDNSGPGAYLVNYAGTPLGATVSGNFQNNTGQGLSLNWPLANVSVPWISSWGSAYALLNSAASGSVVVSAGSLNGSSYDISTQAGSTLVSFAYGVNGEAREQGTVNHAPYVSPGTLLANCILTWSTGVRSTAGGTPFGCSQYGTMNDNGGANPSLLIQDGTVYVKLQLATGTNGIVGTQSNHPMSVSSNNAAVGVAGSFTVYPAGPINIPPVATASLPSCTTGTYYHTFDSVNDSSVNTWGSTVSNGGTYQVLVYCDGANWTVFAK